MQYKSTLIILVIIGISITAQQCNPINNRPTSSKVDYDLLRVTLEKIFDKDQGIRHTLQDSIGYGSPAAPEYFSKMRIIDAENEKVLIPIIERYGWLPRSKIGDKASEAIYCVIQHSSPDLRAKYWPELDSLAKIGEANTTDAASMLDRVLMEKGLKQKYGTQLTRPKIRPDKKMLIWPIADIDKVDSLRKAAGFESTVSENAQRFDAIYNPDEKLPDSK